MVKEIAVTIFEFNNGDFAIDVFGEVLTNDDGEVITFDSLFFAKLFIAEELGGFVNEN